MTADLAVIAMAVVVLTDMILRHRHDMRVADRLRLVNPAKVPVQPPAEGAVAVDLDKRRGAA